LDHYFTPISADSNSLTVINYAQSGRRNIAVKIPSYVPENNIAALLASVSMDPDTGAPVGCTGANGSIASFDPTQDGAALGCAAGCCYQYDASARILRVVASTALEIGAFANLTVGLKYTVNPAGLGLATIARMRPGSNAYYLKKLGKLELSGIPQVPLEPLFCSDNANVLVGGIFNILSGTTNYADLNNNASANSFKDGSGNIYVNHHSLLNEPVFSANDFKCCAPLGKTAASQSKCCSGYGVATGSTSVTCKLPPRTDLMVYFNRFVSNEGQGTDQPGGGLAETDFDDTTGEPKLSSSVSLKITELGKAYCSSGKVRQGGAFGRFEPEPQGPATNLSSLIYNIVDSTHDAGQNANAGSTVSTGYFPFSQGFRWNHHLYCDN
ncbi:MAG: hypothetical protein ACJ76H_01670, partial [Bacteriovoracaceae bacterium]